MAELEARLSALERTVEELKKHRLPEPSEQRHWWRDDAGRFADDPAHEEAMRLGREYRESLRPKPRKAPKSKKGRKDAAS